MTKFNVILTTLFFMAFSSLHASSIVGVADDAFVIKNNTLVFDVLDNDEINGEILGFGIEIHPTYGSVTVNEDKSVTYKPFDDICEEMDYFYYYIEDEEDTKLVEVTIEILCQPLTILNGFYTDVQEDEDSDKPTAFTIVGAENFPSNSLYVFSDTGEEVYFTQGYTNEWNGKNEESEEIESDKVYYYIFNDGVGGTWSGYVQRN